jgi:hypothetical protein
MANKLSKQHFWEWFMRHHNEYLAFNNKPKKEIKYWVNELSAHLRAYYKFLQFSVQYRNADAIGVLTISVAGNARYFKYVDRLVALAPEIPHWIIQALEEPKPIGFLLEEEFEQTGIDPHELWCTVSTRGGLPAITVYHELYAEAKDMLFASVAQMAIYNILGERSYGLDIGPVTAGNLSHAPAKAELIRLEELPAFLPGGHSSLMVDASGKIWEG